jgi:hypothetical protein
LPLVTIEFGFDAESPTDLILRTWASIMALRNIRIELLVPDHVEVPALSKTDRSLSLQVRKLNGKTTLADRLKLARGRYWMNVDGGGFMNADALKTLVQVASQRPCLAISAIVKNGDLSLQPESRITYTMPFPASQLRAAVGYCITNRYALWSRKLLMPILEKHDLRMTSDYAMRSFIVSALNEGAKLDSVPLILMQRFRHEHGSIWEGDSQSELLKSLIETSSAQQAPFVLAAAGFYREAIHFRDRFYYEREKLELLRRSK